MQKNILGRYSKFILFLEALVLSLSLLPLVSGLKQAFLFVMFFLSQLILLLLPLFSLVLSSDCFIFVGDFSPVRQPMGGGKKMYMSIPQQSSVRMPSRGGRERRVLSGENQRSTVDHCILY